MQRIILPASLALAVLVFAADESQPPDRKISVPPASIDVAKNPYETLPLGVAASTWVPLNDRFGFVVDCTYITAGQTNFVRGHFLLKVDDHWLPVNPDESFVSALSESHQPRVPFRRSTNETSSLNSTGMVGRIPFRRGN